MDYSVYIAKKNVENIYFNESIKLQKMEILRLNTVLESTVLVTFHHWLS